MLEVRWSDDDMYDESMSSDGRRVVEVERAISANQPFQPHHFIPLLFIPYSFPPSRFCSDIFTLYPP